MHRTCPLQRRIGSILIQWLRGLASVGFMLNPRISGVNTGPSQDPQPWQRREPLSRIARGAPWLGCSEFNLFLFKPARKGNAQTNTQTNQPTDQLTNQPTSQPASQPTNQPTTQTNKQTNKQTKQSSMAFHLVGSDLRHRRLGGVHVRLSFCWVLRRKRDRSTKKVGHDPKPNRRPRSLPSLASIWVSTW